MKRKLSNIPLLSLNDDLINEILTANSTFNASVEFEECNIDDIDPRFIEFMKKVGVDILSLLGMAAEASAPYVAKAATATGQGLKTAGTTIGSLFESKSNIRTIKFINEQSLVDKAKGAFSSVGDALKRDNGDNFLKAWADTIKMSCENEGPEFGDSMTYDFINQTGKDAFVQIGMPLMQLGMMPMGTICKTIVTISNKFIETLDKAVASYCKGRLTSDQQNAIQGNTDLKALLAALDSIHNTYSHRLFFGTMPQESEIKNIQTVFGDFYQLGKTDKLAIHLFFATCQKTTTFFLERLGSHATSGSTIATSKSSIDMADEAEESKLLGQMAQKLQSKYSIDIDQYNDVKNKIWSSLTRNDYYTENNITDPDDKDDVTFNEYFSWKQGKLDDALKNAYKSERADAETRVRSKYGQLSADEFDNYLTKYKAEKMPLEAWLKASGTADESAINSIKTKIKDGITTEEDYIKSLPQNKQNAYYKFLYTAFEGYLDSVLKDEKDTKKATDAEKAKESEKATKKQERITKNKNEIDLLKIQYKQNILNDYGLNENQYNGAKGRFSKSNSFKNLPQEFYDSHKNELQEIESADKLVASLESYEKETYKTIYSVYLKELDNRFRKYGTDYEDWKKLAKKSPKKTNENLDVILPGHNRKRINLIEFSNEKLSLMALYKFENDKELIQSLNEERIFIESLNNLNLNFLLVESSPPVPSDAKIIARLLLTNNDIKKELTVINDIKRSLEYFDDMSQVTAISELFANASNSDKVKPAIVAYLTLKDKKGEKAEKEFERRLKEIVSSLSSVLSLFSRLGVKLK